VPTRPTTPVYLEQGSRRVFACSLDFPGWCRAGRDEDAALAAFADYAPRYAEVAERGGVEFTTGARPRVLERVAGSATTDFGAPGAVPEKDHRAVDAATARRTAALVRAAWEFFDDVVEDSPAGLRKGPRGGGRDRDKMIDHVLSAEASYARKFGVKLPAPAIGDRHAIEELRAAILSVLGVPGDGAAPRPKGWPARYAARRVAWHVLDHAWEMQDRRG
jgi:hypothetical protein